MRSLTLAEPPIVFEGDTPDESKQQLIKRARAAFAASKPEDAIRAIVDAGQEGKYDRIPPALKSLLIRNAAELKALVTSSEMYPPVKRSALQKLAIPTLLLSGENSTPALKTSDAELERLLPEKHRKRVIIQGADHGLWFQQPDACRNATLDFLKAN